MNVNISSNSCHFTVANSGIAIDTRIRQEQIREINHLLWQNELFETRRIFDKIFLLSKVKEITFEELQDTTQLDYLLSAHAYATVSLPRKVGVIYMPPLSGRSAACKKFKEYTDSDCLAYEDDPIHRGRGTRLTNKYEEIKKAKKEGFYTAVFLVNFKSVVDNHITPSQTHTYDLVTKVSLNSPFLHAHNFKDKWCIYCHDVNVQKTSISARNACIVKFTEKGLTIYRVVNGHELRDILVCSQLKLMCERGWETQYYNNERCDLGFALKKGLKKLKMDEFEKEIVKLLLNAFNEKLACKCKVYFEKGFYTLTVEGLNNTHYVIRYAQNGTTDVAYKCDSEYADALAGYICYDVSLQVLLQIIFTLK